jgi:uroporphyrinogen-III synthase
MKRISLMLKKEQYDRLSEEGINTSGLVRDLLDDYLSEHKVTISVTEETRALYDKIVSNTGSTDDEVEVYFRKALEGMLDDKIREMQNLQKNLSGMKPSASSPK